MGRRRAGAVLAALLWAGGVAAANPPAGPDAVPVTPVPDPEAGRVHDLNAASRQRNVAYSDERARIEADYAAELDRYRLAKDKADADRAAFDRARTQHDKDMAAWQAEVERLRVTAAEASARRTHKEPHLLAAHVDDDAVVCREVTGVGSHLSKKECRTRAAWRALEGGR